MTTLDYHTFPKIFNNFITIVFRIFYLVTTDILGPFSVPWAMSQLGYVPGFVLYTIFGILCFYSGSQLWKQFLGLDSEKYPVKSYGDLAYRIYGRWAHHGVNVLQSLQFFLNVTLLIVGSGQAIVQLAEGSSGKGHFCCMPSSFASTIITIPC